MRTGAQYLDSLKDGREIFINGEKVKDVTTHPAFSGVCKTAAALYDFVAEHEKEMTFISPKTGKPVALWHLIPRSNDDLKQRRLAISRLANQTYGLLGRSPDHVASFVAGFASAPQVFAKNGQKFADNIVRFHEKLRDEHLYATYTIIPPQIDRSKTASQQADSHLAAGVFAEKENGIVIRGAMMLGTATAISDCLYLSCIQPLQPGDEPYAISVALPVNSPGLRLYPRRPYALGQPSVFDYPLSTRFDESDSLAVFRDVFVPWENVFVYKDVALTRDQWFKTPAHILGNAQAQTRLVTKVKFLLGLARKIAAANGTDKIPTVAWDLGEMASWAAVVEGMMLAAESTAVRNDAGVAHPNPRFLYGAMGLQSQTYPRMIQIARELAGGGLLQVPSSVSELTSPDTGDDIRRYVKSSSLDAEARVKLFKLAWDILGSEFAGRHLQYEMFYAGAPFVAKNYSFMNYNFSEATALVDECLAGYGI